MQNQEHDITKKLPKETIKIIDEAVTAGRESDAFLATGCQNKYQNPSISSYSCRGCSFFYRESIRSAPECEVSSYITKKWASLRPESTS